MMAKTRITTSAAGRGGGVSLTKLIEIDEHFLAFHYTLSSSQTPGI
jgi:hypothetical protein